MDCWDTSKLNHYRAERFKTRHVAVRHYRARWTLTKRAALGAKSANASCGPAQSTQHCTCVHTHLKRFNAATRVRRVGGRGRERRLGDPGSTATDEIARRRRRRRRRCRLLRPIPERLPWRSEAPACARPWSEPACTLRPAGFKLRGVGGLKEEVLIVRHGGAECKGARGLASQRGGTRGQQDRI